MYGIKTMKREQCVRQEVNRIPNKTRRNGRLLNWAVDVTSNMDGIWGSRSSC